MTGLFLLLLVMSGCAAPLEETGFAVGLVASDDPALSVRVGQNRGPMEFSFNICEPIDDPFYAGNRYPELRFSAERP